jgi:endonuclease/exonuclease/phosphatase family metal-dependent hydrolase
LGIGLDVLATKGWFRLDLVNRVTGRPLRVINTHLQADIDLVPEYFMKRTEGIRMAQARQLVAAERSSNIPTLLIGDLNTDQDLFEGFQFFPAEAHTDEFKGIDRCGFLEREEGSGWSVVDWLVGKEAEGWSDHLPVLWTLRLNNM